MWTSMAGGDMARCVLQYRNQFCRALSNMYKNTTLSCIILSLGLIWNGIWLCFFPSRKQLGKNAAIMTLPLWLWLFTVLLIGYGDLPPRSPESCPQTKLSTFTLQLSSSHRTLWPVVTESYSVTSAREYPKITGVIINQVTLYHL